MKLKWPCRIFALVVALPVLLLLYDAARPVRYAVGMSGLGFLPPAPLGMNSNFLSILVFGLVAGWIITTWVRAKYGYPFHDGMGNPVHKERPREGSLETLKAALLARDAHIASLEERVRVLERIVTDRRSALAEEFERLRT
jgi:hypothetical protein